MRSRARACARGTAVGGRPATTTCLLHVFPLPARPSARLLTALLTLCLTALTDQAHASSAQLPNGLGVVLDRASMTRVGSIDPGQIVSAYVVTDTGEQPDAIRSLRAYQFGLDIDPRLELLGIDLPPQVNFPNFPAPRDYQFGLGDCLDLNAGPVVLLRAHLRLLVAPPATDLRVDVRPLSDGREMQFAPCSNPGDLQRFQPAGGVVLNPAAPSIVHFGGSPPVVVEGRPLSLAWETWGAQTVTLDGAPVVAGSTEILHPTASHTWILEVGAGAATASRQWSAEVIRSPRIDDFNATGFGVGGQLMVALRWDVQGATEILLDDTQHVPALGGQLGPLKSPPVWRLDASNEWGTTSALAGLDAAQLPPSILQFTASPNPFHAGESVTLAWSVASALSATINNGVGDVSPVNGFVTVQPPASTSYILTATNAWGNATANVFVQLLPPGIHSFTATPSQIFPGESTLLHWQVESTLQLTLEPGIGPVAGPTGELRVTPTQPLTVYALTAANPSGSVHAYAEVDWKIPVATLSVSDTTPYAIDPILLTAVINGASAASLEPLVGSIPPSGGQFQVVVGTPTTFTLTASNAAGSVARRVGVTPRKPTASLQVSNATPYADEPIDLTAAVAGAASATLEPGFGTISPTGGTFATTVPTTTTFVLNAVNDAGATTQRVTVTPKAPQIISFQADPPLLTNGQTGSLVWSVTHADETRIEPGGFAGLPATGSVAITPSQTTTYTLTARNPAGSSTATARVDVGVPFSIQTFYAIPTVILPGQFSTLTWVVIGSASVSIDGLGAQPPAGELAVQPDVTTTYTLRAQSGDYVRTATAQVTVGMSWVVPGALVLSWSRDSYPGFPPPIQPFTPFDFWVVAMDPPGGLLGYECSVHLPQGVIVAGGRSFFPNGALDVATGDDNWIIGTGGVCLQGAFIPLIRYAACLFIGPVPASAEIALGPAVPTSFPEPGLPGRPGYLSCLAAGDLRPFTTGPPLELNPTVPTPALTLGLTAEPVSGGVQLRWVLGSPGDESTALQLHSVALLRRAADEAPRALITLDGADARSSSSWTDVTALPQVAYRYWAVAQVNGIPVASLEVEAVRDAPGSAIAHQTRLLPNVPNPFNPRTEIRFELARPGTVRLELFDAAGRLVRRVELPAQSTGRHTWTWRGEDDAGNPVGSGVYRVRLTADGGGAAGAADTRSITLVR
jgi:hypothetical protein